MSGQTINMRGDIISQLQKLKLRRKHNSDIFRRPGDKNKDMSNFLAPCQHVSQIGIVSLLSLLNNEQLLFCWTHSPLTAAT